MPRRWRQSTCSRTLLAHRTILSIFLRFRCCSMLLSLFWGLLHSRCKIGGHCESRRWAASSGMRKSATWAPAPNLKVLAVERNGTDWIVAVEGLDHGTCPVCGLRSISRHSSYRRTLQDLSAQGKTVSVRARMTRWRCRNDRLKGGSSPSVFPSSPPHSRGEPPGWPELSGFSATASADARRNA